MRIIRCFLFTVALVGTPACVAGQNSTNSASDKVRILVTEADSWKVDARHPKAADVAGLINKKCPGVAATADFRKESDYVVRLERDAKQPPANADLVILTPDGDAAYTSSKPLEEAVTDTCAAIKRGVKPGETDPFEGGAGQSEHEH